MLFTSILILIVAKAIPLIKISSTHFTRISAIILLLSGILSFNILYIQSIGSGIGIYSGLFQITNISQTIELFLLIIGFIILIGWPLIKNSDSEYGYEKLVACPTLTGVRVGQKSILAIAGANKNIAIDYSIIVLFSTLGSSLLVSSFDLISIYLSIELQSFGLYILSTIHRNSENSTNAGLKYFLLGGFSSCIILLGAGIIYSYTGNTQLESIYTLLSSITYANVNYMVQGTLFGIVLIIIGLLFKIAAAPLHNWSPDVYDETPTIVTIWLTIMPKISILILLLEIYLVANANYAFGYNIGQNFPLIVEIATQSQVNLGEDATSLITNNWINTACGSKLEVGAQVKNILLISSIFSLIIGTVVGLAQIKIKRLLAYSTISHIGFMLLALAINTEQSIDSFLFYLVQYIITNLNIFFILLAISYFKLDLNLNKEIVDIKYIKDLQGLFTMNPLLSLTFSISLFSMAGIPPLIGFFSKQFVLYSAIDQGYYLLSIIAIIVSVISASYYLKIIKIIHTLPSTDHVMRESLSIKEDYTQPNSFRSVATKAFAMREAGATTRLAQDKAVADATLSSSHSFIISSLSLFILLFIFKPTLILSSTQVLSLTLFNV